MLNILSKIKEKILVPKKIAYSEASTEKDVLRDFDVPDKDLLLAFKSTPIVNRFIRYRADLIISRGYHFDYPDNESKEIITRFLKNIKKNDIPFHNDLNNFLRDLCIDCDWHGNGFLQLIQNKNSNMIIKIHKLHPLYIDFIRDSTGNIIFDKLGNPEGYSLSTEEKELKIDEVAHLVFERVGDELLGTSLILPAFRSIERLVNIDWAMAKALYKHGLPTRDISVGDSDHEPDIDEIKKVAEQVTDIDSAPEYTHPYWYKVDTIDPKWPSNVVEVPRYFMSKVIAISGIPHHILLGEETIGTRATAESLQQGLSILLEPLQKKIKSLVESQIFRQVLDLEGSDAEVKMVWKSNVPRVVLPFADKVLSLSQVVIDGKQVISWKDARDLLQMPSEEDMAEGFSEVTSKEAAEK
jgi:hypothetical protein